MKCKDCNSMCKYRSSDAEKECFYLQPQHDNLSTELKTCDQVDEERHWQDVRERAAIAAMQSMISTFYERQTITTFSSMVVKNAVNYADELVKFLKNGETEISK